MSKITELNDFSQLLIAYLDKCNLTDDDKKGKYVDG